MEQHRNPWQIGARATRNNTALLDSIIVSGSVLCVDDATGVINGIYASMMVVPRQSFDSLSLSEKTKKFWLEGTSRWLTIGYEPLAVKSERE